MILTDIRHELADLKWILPAESFHELDEIYVFVTELTFGPYLQYIQAINFLYPVTHLLTFVVDYRRLHCLS